MDRDQLGNPAPHRGADDVRLADLEVVKQPRGVEGHVLERVRSRGGRPVQQPQEFPEGGHGRFTEDRRAPTVAIVEPNHPEPALREL